MPRFVILEHNHPQLHWDLMLEEEFGLLTWRLATPPEVGKPIEATALPTHRHHYLDYEGPVSNNRGIVAQWTAGTFSWHQQQEDLMILAMDSERCRGKVRLQQQSEGLWIFTLSHDPC